MTTGTAEGVALVGGEADIECGNSSRPGEETLALHIHVSENVGLSFHRNVKYTSPCAQSTPQNKAMWEFLMGGVRKFITYQPSHDKSYGCSYHTGGRSQHTLF